MTESAKTTPPINALDALVALTRAVRPAWDVPGVRSAIRQALAREQQPTLAELAYALIRCAENPGINAPVVVALDGAHWGKAMPESSEPQRTRFCKWCGEFHLPTWDCERAWMLTRDMEPEALAAYLARARDGIKPSKVVDREAEKAQAKAEETDHA